MEINAQNNNGRCAVVLGGELTIYVAAELKAGLVDAVGACAETEINLAAVSDIDTAGLQVLVLAKREAAAAGNDTALDGLVQVFIQMRELYNVAALFGDPLVIPAREPGRFADGGRV